MVSYFGPKGRNLFSSRPSGSQSQDFIASGAGASVACHRGSRPLNYKSLISGPATRVISGQSGKRVRKGVGGRGLTTNKPPKRAKKVLQKCVPLLLRGHRKKVQKRGLNLWPLKDFLAPTPSVRQPLFETSESGKRVRNQLPELRGPKSPKSPKERQSWERLNGGLANGGLRYLSTIVHDCLQLSSFCDESSPNKKGDPKGPQKCTIVDDCVQIAESGLKPSFESKRSQHS